MERRITGGERGGKLAWWSQRGWSNEGKEYKKVNLLLPDHGVGMGRNRPASRSIRRNSPGVSTRIS